MSATESHRGLNHSHVDDQAQHDNGRDGVKHALF